MTTQISKRQLKNNVMTVSNIAPTASDDSSFGFQIGSFWFDNVTDTLYTCTNASVGTAVWAIVTDPNALTSITSGDVTTALGFTPYDASNPNNYLATVTTDGTTTTGDGTIGNPIVATQYVVTDKIQVSSAEILALNGTPKILITAPAVSAFIQVIDLSVALNFVTTPYATNTDLEVRNIGSTDVIANNQTSLLDSAGTLRRFVMNTTDAETPAGTGVELTVNTGNPTAGDGTLDIYITYCIINL
jgi:hypothetical protein